MARVPRPLRLLPLVLVLTLALAATARAEPSPTALARALAASPSRTGAAALDLETGESLFALHASLPLLPASNEKLAVTFAALRELGAGFTFQTLVLGDGEQDDEGTWTGDLVLQGHGDPTLSAAGLDDLAAQVAASGIRRVTGRVLADETAFDARRTGPGWKPWYYIGECAPLSALAVDRARVGRGTSPEPALSAGVEFRAALVQAGVAVAGGVAKAAAPPDATLLGEVDSAPLGAILRFMDHESDNYTAELLLKQLGTVDGVQGSSASGARVVRRDLADAGVPLAGVRIADGSGLSLLDRTTAGALTATLEAAWDDPELHGPFFSALAVAGVNGTLAGRMRRAPARVNVVAKTGTTSAASALSGYARRRYAFAVVQNGHPVPLWSARTAQDRFATVLAGG
jgi:D-alanyl-D-alanine carboxypeptidase/D-alanyl-D-alanine-endopeptidase (penicillin-binding protein 4)